MSNWGMDEGMDKGTDKPGTLNPVQGEILHKEGEQLPDLESASFF